MSRVKGFAKEDDATDWLVSRGFEIVERNFQKRFGEIDIIAKKSGVIHFIEVKSGEGFDPIYAFTSRKISKVIKTATQWLQSYKGFEPYCIDALIIRDNEIELIENITI